MLPVDRDRELGPTADAFRYADHVRGLLTGGEILVGNFGNVFGIGRWIPNGGFVPLVVGVHGHGDLEGLTRSRVHGTSDPNYARPGVHLEFVAGLDVVGNQHAKDGSVGGHVDGTGTF